jgi:glycosyltransferase involved in cell wall biosynthesis
MTSTSPIDGDSSPASPQVTVVITAYNHERFIEQAIRSALTQSTTFPVEILVADDCSTDGSPVIIERLFQEHPGRLKVLPRPKNLGISANLQDCREQAQGKYLAILEGDDYWVDSRKLQKMFDAMEAHPDWSMCFHGTRVFAEDGSRDDIIKPDVTPTRPMVVNDFLLENQVQTMSSAMYRQGVVRRTPGWHANIRIGDWALNILHADVGPVGFVPGIMTAYRVHGRGMWSSLHSFKQWLDVLALFSNLEQHFKDSREREFREAKEIHIRQFSDRVSYLEKVERRYESLQLHRVAACCRWIQGLLGRTREDRPTR